MQYIFSIIAISSSFSWESQSLFSCPLWCLTNEITLDHFSFAISSHKPVSNSSTFKRAGEAVADEIGVGVPPSASVSSIARDRALFIVAISAVTSLN